MYHPAWQGFGDEYPSHLKSRNFPFKLVRENSDFAEVIGHCIGILEMILDKSFTSHRVGVSGVFPQSLAEDDGTPGVLHLGMYLF